MNEVFKSKTTWTGISAIIAAAAGYFTGQMDMAGAMQTAFTGLIGIFLRQGVAKVGRQ